MNNLICIFRKLIIVSGIVLLISACAKTTSNQPIGGKAPTNQHQDETLGGGIGGTGNADSCHGDDERAKKDCDDPK